MAKFKYLQLGALVGGTATDFAIEDMFPTPFYLECVNEAYGTNLTEADLPSTGSTQVAKRVEATLQQRGRIQDKLDKRVIMIAMQRRFDKFTDVNSLPAGTADKICKAVAGINKAFS
jgi:hypothetical protein